MSFSMFVIQVQQLYSSFLQTSMMASDKSAEDTTPLANSQNYAPNTPLHRGTTPDKTEYGALKTNSKEGSHEHQPFMDKRDSDNIKDSAEKDNGDDVTVVVAEGNSKEFDPDADTPASNHHDALTRCHRHCVVGIEFIQNHVHGFFARHAQLFRIIFFVLLLIGYVVYFIYAIWYSPWGAIVLIVLTTLVVLTWTVKLVSRHWGTEIKAHVCLPISKICHRPWWRHIRRYVYHLV